MYERLDACPSCGHTSLSNDRILIDHSISKESFALTTCNKCDFLFTNPRPDEHNLGRYYESEDYISHADKSNSLINRVYKVVRNITLNQKIKHIKDHSSDPKSLLDIGTGTGYFLSAAKKQGWEIMGVEPDDGARSIAEQNTGQKIKASLFEIDKANNSYDVITLWHVLEHLPRLSESLTHIKNLTHSKSTLFIAVPNHRSKDATEYGEHWAAWDVPRHLYHFTQNTMRDILARHGFRLVKRIPMPFDAYYVSMLSEQYKTGKKGYWQGFRNGMKSNHWARNNDKEYSSVIYVAEKK